MSDINDDNATQHTQSNSGKTITLKLWQFIIIVIVVAVVSIACTIVIALYLLMLAENPDDHEETGEEKPAR